jgi:hypothetical protein
VGCDGIEMEKLDRIRDRTGLLLMAIASCTAIGATFYIAFVTSNETILNMLAGASISAFTSFIQYFAGSSAGSERKTEIIAASAPPTFRQESKPLEEPNPPTPSIQPPSPKTAGP